MSTPNWLSTELDHEFHVYMVDPLNHESSYGELEAYSDTGTITYSLGDGAQVGASLEFPDWSRWRKNTWLRVVHEIPSCKYSKVLGTFIVWDEGISHGLGTDTASPELASCLRGIEQDLLHSLLAIGARASLKKAIDRVLRETPMTYEIANGARDYVFSDPHVFDIGKSRLDVIRELCAISGNEIRAGANGSILIVPHERYADRVASWHIDEDSPTTPVIEGSVKRVSTDRAIAGRSIAVWHGEGTDGQDYLSAFANVSQKHLASPEARGYVISTLHELDDLPGDKTYAEVYKEAKKYLNEDSQSSYGWTLQTMWLPIEVGDIVDFRPRDGVYVSCVVESMTQNLSTWLLDLTLKEVQI